MQCNKRLAHNDFVLITERKSISIIEVTAHKVGKVHHTVAGSEHCACLKEANRYNVYKYANDPSKVSRDCAKNPIL